MPPDHPQTNSTEAMDLNTVIDSLTSVSEYFVATNTRTSFTDLVESGSLRSAMSTPTPTHQQHHATSNNNSVCQGANNRSSATTPASDSNNISLTHNNNTNSNNNNSNNNNGSNSSSSGGLANNASNMSNHHNLSNSSSRSPNLLVSQQTFPHQSIHTVHSNKSLIGSPVQFTNYLQQQQQQQQQQNHHHHHHHSNSVQSHTPQPVGITYSSYNSHNPYTSHNVHGQANGTSHCIASSGSAVTLNNNNLTQSRLSQRVRAQIPIHCYIEQLDDLPGYCSPINDSDLFSTAGPTSNGNQSNRQASTNHQQVATHQHQPYLHQSKLALESVTNGTNLNLNTPSSSNSINAHNLYNENNSANDDNNDIDHLDNLNSDSPLSLNPLSNDESLEQQQSTIGNTNSIPNKNPSNQTTQSSIISHSVSRTSSAPLLASISETPHLQSYRETIAIVTSNVLYQDLVRTVLLQLGYSDIDLINAKGKLFINAFAITSFSYTGFAFVLDQDG